MDDAEREYLEGKIVGLRRVCIALLYHIGNSRWADLPTRIEWTLGFSEQLDMLITGLEKSPVILTPRGKGQRDAIAEIKANLFSE